MDSAASNPTVRWHGDLAEYTGNEKAIHGGWFYELLMLEGHRVGTSVWTQRKPGQDDRIGSFETR